MNQYYQIFDNSSHAEMAAKFAVVQCLLQDEPRWGADVLEMAGEYHWRVLLTRRQSRWLRASRIYPETPEHFIVFTPVGKRANLAYEISKLDENHIQVIPVGYLPYAFKVASLVALLLLMVLPALLAPLVWRLHEAATLRYSRLYLDAFCRWLQSRLHETVQTPDGV